MSRPAAKQAIAVTGFITLRLPYRAPYDLDAVLAFLRNRALPGIEQVDESRYARVFGPASAPGWLEVSAWPDGSPALRLRIHDPVAEKIPDRVVRVRRMFDLDADPRSISRALCRSPQMRTLVAKYPGVRLPGSWDGFEVAVRAILGQQVSVAAARTLASRIVTRFGEPLVNRSSSALAMLFPTPHILADADLRELGITTARAACIRAVSRAVLDGRVHFDAGQSLDDFVADWVALPGIGEWTAHYMAMRALSHCDAFPAADLVLRRVAALPGETLSTRALTALAETWRPCRAYAVILLWRCANDVASKSQSTSMNGSTARKGLRP